MEDMLRYIMTREYTHSIIMYHFTWPGVSDKTFDSSNRSGGRSRCVVINMHIDIHVVGFINILYH